jgi:hypothetical protein
MHHVPQAGLTALAVAGPVERRVRPRARLLAWDSWNRVLWLSGARLAKGDAAPALWCLRATLVDHRAYRREQVRQKGRASRRLPGWKNGRRILSA